MSLQTTGVPNNKASLIEIASPSNNGIVYALPIEVDVNYSSGTIDISKQSTLIDVQGIGKYYENS